MVWWSAACMMPPVLTPFATCMSYWGQETTAAEKFTADAKDRKTNKYSNLDQTCLFMPPTKKTFGPFGPKSLAFVKELHGEQDLPRDCRGDGSKLRHAVFVHDHSEWNHGCMGMQQWLSFVHLSTFVFNCENFVYKILHIGQMYFLQRNLTIFRRIARVKLIFVRLRRKRRWKIEKQLLFPVEMGDEAIAISSSCIREHLAYKETRNSIIKQSSCSTWSFITQCVWWCTRNAVCVDKMGCSSCFSTQIC